MPDFDPPFAEGGDYRFPTSTEQNLGYPCGPLDQPLLNGLYRITNGNIAKVIEAAGVTGPDGDLTKLLRSIEGLIAAATGGGTLDDFILMAQARARLPIYPDVDTADGRINVTSPGAGTVRLPGGVTFLHRGIFPITTTQQDFATDPSKTYHLRWHKTDGYVLRDLASGTYNPGTLAETNETFDSDFDDMLIARVITNSSNVASITNVANKDDLYINEVLTATNFQRSGLNGASAEISKSINWSRTPKNKTLTWVSQQQAGVAADQDFIIGTRNDRSDTSQQGTAGVPCTRYALDAIVGWDFANSIQMLFDARA